MSLEASSTGLKSLPSLQEAQRLLLQGDSNIKDLVNKSAFADDLTRYFCVEAVAGYFSPINAEPIETVLLPTQISFRAALGAMSILSVDGKTHIVLDFFRAREFKSEKRMTSTPTPVSHENLHLLGARREFALEQIRSGIIRVPVLAISATQRTRQSFQRAKHNKQLQEYVAA